MNRKYPARKPNFSGGWIQMVTVKMVASSITPIERIAGRQLQLEHRLKSKYLVQSRGFWQSGFLQVGLVSFKFSGSTSDR